jgi:hypothetical protein
MALRILVYPAPVGVIPLRIAVQIAVGTGDSSAVAIVVEAEQGEISAVGIVVEVEMTEYSFASLSIFGAITKAH